MGQVGRRRFLAAAGALLAGVPRAPWAQQSERMRVIGWLGRTIPEPEQSIFQEAFLHTLREHGFVEGKNLAMLRRYSEGPHETYSELAKEAREAQRRSNRGDGFGRSACGEECDAQKRTATPIAQV